MSFVTVDRVRTDMYLICELSNEILVIELNFHPHSSSFTTHTRQIISTLPANVPPNNTFNAGEIRISSDHRFLYATNRQKDLTRPREENNMLIFERGCDGDLKSNPMIVSLSVTGFTPRHFAFSVEDQERWMVVVAQQDNQVGVYSRDPKLGGLTYVDQIEVEKPTVAQFLALEPKGTS